MSQDHSAVTIQPQAYGAPPQQSYAVPPGYAQQAPGYPMGPPAPPGPQPIGNRVIYL